MAPSPRTKRKYIQNPEPPADARVRPTKRLRKSDPTIAKASIVENTQASIESRALNNQLLPSKDKLSEENLQLLNMESQVDRPTATKRTSSRRSTIALSETESSKSSSTTAHYRYKNLGGANIYVYTDLPKDIRVTVDDIIMVKPPPDQHTILLEKACRFSKECKEMVRAATSEDDFVHTFYTILKEISPSGLIFREKADWRVELKPRTLQSRANLSLLSSPDYEENQDNTSSLPPSKRQQPSPDHPYLSPQYSRSSDLNSIVEKSERPLIKTPRPDITMGIDKSALITALVSSLASPSFDYIEAQTLLGELQDTTIQTKRDGPREPAFIMVPTQRESNITFPTLVLEGKAYCTGKQIFEAQNQAAVSGASGLRVQAMLDELVRRVTKNSISPYSIVENHRPPLFFSICTEGPYHELWVHHTIMEGDKRQFNMTLLNTCNGCLVKQVDTFLVQIYNVMTWTSGIFFRGVVQRLQEVATKLEA